MTEFDIEQFEARLKALVDAYERLKTDYRSLQATLEAEQRKNEHTRQRLGRIIERIRALETQAEDSGSDNNYRGSEP